jgi:hypothetical protein
MRYLQRGDEVAVERMDDRVTHGTFIREDDEYIVVRGTVGDRIGKEILVPKSRVTQVVIVKKAPTDAWEIDET